jgi:hypothetical protein
MRVLRDKQFRILSMGSSVTSSKLVAQFGMTVCPVGQACFQNSSTLTSKNQVFEKTVQLRVLVAFSNIFPQLVHSGNRCDHVA